MATTDMQPQHSNIQVRIDNGSPNMDYNDEISDASDLSSVASASPSPPPGWCPPSPPPSQDHDDSPRSLNAQRRARNEPDDAPPAPKRRKVEPKPRTTQYLDLTPVADPLAPEQKTQLDLLLKTLRNNRKIVVIAGAGISVSAGIPDFRSTDGLFTTLKKDHKLKTSGKELFDASVYHDGASTSSFHDMVRSLSGMAASAEPSAFHHLLARLAKTDRLLRLYTQNVDGIETSLEPLATEVPLATKAPWPRTIQLHGGLEKMVCQKCRHTSNFKAELFQGPTPPLCEECSAIDVLRKQEGHRSHGIGRLRPRIVLYNEHNPDEEAIGSVVTSDLRTRPDALIVVGTSLKIPGVRRIVREMSRVVRGRKNGVTMWINQDSVPMGKEFQDCWDLVIKGECDQVARHAGLRSWDDDKTDDIFDDSSTKQKSASSTNLSTPKKQQKLSNNNGILTPSSSQDEGSTTAEVPASKPVVKALGNPASKGRSISSMVGESKKPAQTKAKKPAAKKPAAKKPAPNKKGRAGKEQSNKINKQMSVTKAAERQPVQSGKVDSSKPMQAVSPGAARNNGPAIKDSPSPDCEPKKETNNRPCQNISVVPPSSTEKA